MAEPAARPVYAVLFIDAINVKIREGQVANRPIYLALGVTVDGERDVLGLWAGEHGDGEGAKFWLRILSEIKNRGVRDVCMLVCDGLKACPMRSTPCGRRPSCKLHCSSPAEFLQVRLEERLGRHRERPQARLHRRLEAEALDRFAEFSGKWEKRYPAIIRLWENAGRNSCHSFSSTGK